MLAIRDLLFANRAQQGGGMHAARGKAFIAVRQNRPQAPLPNKCRSLPYRMRVMTGLGSFGDALRVHARIIFATILRDVRTRFGRSHISYLVAIAWPLSHLAVVMIGFLRVSRMVPLGTDSAVFIATGILPYILCFIRLECSRRL